MPLRPCFALLGALLFSSAAFANGRFPRSQRVIEDPDDPARLIVGATYGLLTTTDRGATWHHLCESSFAGMSLATFDCVFDRVEGGALLAAYGAALSRAAPPYCDFSATLASDEATRVVDFSVIPGSPREVIAIVTRREEGAPGLSVLSRSDDGGETFVELDTPLPAVENFAVTVDSAPTNPSRVYVSGLDAERNGVLLVSDDGGEHFEPRAIPGVTGNGPPYIAAVHPLWENTVFVRTDGFENDPFGERVANDALLVTHDAGQSFTELIRGGAKLYGFALSPDGTRLLVGFGDPRDVTVDPETLGIHSASVEEDSVSAFVRETTEAVSCLRFSERGLYVCATDFEVGFQLGFREDADLSGGLTSFTPLLLLSDVVGPLDCPENSSGALCAEDWQSVCEAFQAECPDAGPDGNDDTPKDGGGGGCACRSVGGGGSVGAAAIAAGLAFILRGRVRRRRSARER